MWRIGAASGGGGQSAVVNAVAKTAVSVARASTGGAAVTAESNGDKALRKILVANRGEIAVRVLETARKMGVRTVAVYSDADANAQHVKAADEAFNIGPADSSESYLRMDKIIDVAKRTGAQGIHPGYGFLSENAKFATQLEAEGIEFIGPPASAITSMGSKSESKRIMLAADVPCVPGYHGDDQTEDGLVAKAKEMGFPIMIKAVLGGGGKGMRIAETPKSFLSQLRSARGEAMNAFGDDRVLLERYIKRSRHVEVQVFADKYGDAVYLYERDCSVQRRHQKVIEEAPAPGLSEELRVELGEAAVRAAKAVGYVGAGTVEFIMDTADMKFYFMEMNTRLQVEHPVTEMITGQDLVEWQLKIAGGEPLPVKQSDLRRRGHSFEARIYAEDPLNNFRPGSGPLRYMKLPANLGPDVRVDSGVKQGDAVSVYYDPMIAKLVVWGENRRAALSKLTAALHDFHIAGLSTNISFVGDIATNAQFEAGNVSTALIEENEETLLQRQVPKDSMLVQAAIAVLDHDAQLLAAAQAHSADTSSPWGTVTGLRSSDNTPRDLTLNIGDDSYDVSITTHADGSYTVVCPTQTYTNVRSKPIPERNHRALQCTIDGVMYESSPVVFGDEVHIFTTQGELHASLPVPDFVADASGASGDLVVAPMDGSIQQVLVKPGDVVEQDQPVLVLYAMKMESVLRAPRAGVIKSVSGAVGAQVALNSILVSLEPPVDADGKDGGSA